MPALAVHPDLVRLRLYEQEQEVDVVRDQSAPALSPMELAQQVQEAEEAAFVALFGVASSGVRGDKNGTI